MKKVLLFVLAACLSQVAHAESPFLGKWNTEKSEEGAWLTVELQPCGDKLCGTIVDAHNVKDASIVGTEMIKDMQQKSKTSYGKGKIYAPDMQKWYKSNMRLEGEGQLKVAGCVLGVICRSQVWTRAE